MISGSIISDSCGRSCCFFAVLVAVRSSLSLLKLSAEATRHGHCRDKETETIIEVDIG